MVQRKKQTDDVAALRAENEQLKKELAALRASPPVVPRKRRSFRSVARTVGVWLSVALATALLVAGNLLFWAGNTIVDQSKFTALVNPLIEKPEVQQAIATYTTDQLFQRVDIQQLLAENLPERISFAAPAIANQVKVGTQNVLTNILASDQFQNIWNTAIDTSHERTITFIKNYQGDGVIRLSDVYNQLIQRLDGTQLSFLTKISLPEHVGSITLVNASWLPFAHNIVNNITLYRYLAVIACIGFAALAVALARNKRRVTITIGVMFMVFMVLTSVAIRITQHQFIGQVPSSYQAAAQVASDHVLSTLVLQTRALFVFGLLATFVAWISGPYRGSVMIRKQIQTLFNGNVHQALIGTHDNSFTRWVGAHRRAIEWVFVGLAGLFVVLTPISVSTMLWTLVILIVMILATEIVAAPMPARTPTKTTSKPRT